MVSYNSVTYNKRSDALSIRLRLSHSYGCLSKDLCLYSWTIDLSTSTREKRRSGVSVIKSTKWKSQQQNSRKSTNDLNQPRREKKMKSKKFILWVRTIIISCEKDLSLLNLYSCYFILDLCLRKKATSKQRECNYWRHDDDNIIWIGLSIVKVVTVKDFAHFWRRFPMQAVIEDTNFSLFRVAAHFWKKY